MRKAKLLWGVVLCAGAVLGYKKLKTAEEEAEVPMDLPPYFDEDGREYPYCLTLIGSFPNGSKETTLVVYTDNLDLTFDEASRSLYSEDAKDFRDMYIVSMA